MRQLTTLAVLLVALTFGATATAAPINIDNFKSGNFDMTGAASTSTSGTTVATYFGGSGLGVRGLTVPLPSISTLATPATITIAETGLSTANVFGGNRTAVIQIDSFGASQGDAAGQGVRANLNTTASGLLSLNPDNIIDASLTLTYSFPTTSFNGQDGFLIDFFNLEAGILNLTTVITDGGSSSSIVTINQATNTGPFTLFIPFSGFAPVSGGGANLGTLTTISFNFNGSTSQDLGIDNIRTLETPEPATLAICGIFGIAGLVTARRKLKKSVEPTVAA